MLERLIEDGCHLAMHNGAETLTEALLDEVRADLSGDPHRDASAGEVPAVPGRPDKEERPKRPARKPSRKNGSFDDAGPDARAIGA
jgi:hypothetical protein